MIPRRFYIFDATPNNVRISISLFYVFEAVVTFDVLFCFVSTEVPLLESLYNRHDLFIYEQTVLRQYLSNCFDDCTVFHALCYIQSHARDTTFTIY